MIPDSSAPLTVEELCKNLLAIKPGDPFECRNVSDDFKDKTWLLNPSPQEDGFETPLEAVRGGYDVRPLPVKKFVLLYSGTKAEYCHSPDSCLNMIVSRNCSEKFYIRVQAVVASSVTAAAALAAPQPGETFLAAVPYPEAQ